MMSDAVEASTQSLPEKSQQSLSDMIDRVIDHQLSSGQLDNADITLKEIHQIREAFKSLCVVSTMSVFHTPSHRNRLTCLNNSLLS